LIKLNEFVIRKKTWGNFRLFIISLKNMMKSDLRSKRVHQSSKSNNFTSPKK